ncbi:histidine phosphatase family protein [Halalkalibacter okhensis]|uniref:Alpha-ribazole phosphatase n=1 Tax=Halalkalibacter okhensis TaxID=333138 RepID=A0A0B0IM59_9BACI|nr:histidine phosphatase family protein [Halalkalibacter okhensis]KHF40751.1 hypothetical protein LQ50_08190 [Halalkalibacter okhensis]
MGACSGVDLFLVRHSVTRWNKEKRYLGHTDIPIIWDEATNLLELKGALSKIDFTYVFSSDLQRCQETLAFLQLSKQARTDRRLREMDFGDWEGKTYLELQHDPSYRKWLDNWEGIPIPNGESSKAFQERIDAFLYELLHYTFEQNKKEKQQVLVMTHGGVIRYIISKMIPAHTFWSLTVNHGQALKLSFVLEKGEWVCSLLSEVPSQEKEKL